MSDVYTQYELEPYLYDECDNMAQKDFAFGLNLKIQAIMMLRNGVDGRLTNLYDGVRRIRDNSLDMIESFVSALDSTIFERREYEVVDDGYGYYSYGSFPDVAKYASYVSDVFREYDLTDDADSILEYIDYLEYEDEEERDGVVQMVNDLIRCPKDSDLVNDFLEWVNRTHFESSLDLTMMLDNVLFFIRGYAPGGEPRIATSYVIKGLDLRDKELSTEIDVLKNPLSIYWYDPICVQMGGDVFLSYIVYGDLDDDCYATREMAVRPFWKLTAKRIEETIKRRGESA